MKTRSKPLQRCLSLLLSALMLLSSVQALASALTAAEDFDYGPLMQALAALPADLKITVDVRSNNAANSPQNRSTLDGTYRADYGEYWDDGNDAGGSWVVSQAGRPVWNALGLYHQATEEIFDYRQDYVLGNIASLNSSWNNWWDNPAILKAVPAAQITTKQQNYTSPQLRDTIKNDIVELGGANYSTVLNWFSGNFLINANSQDGGAFYDLLDTPRASFFSANVFVDNTNNWRKGFRKTPGGFAVLRSPLEAIQEGPNNLDALPDAVTYNTARSIEYLHEVEASSQWSYENKYALVMSMSSFVRLFWHRLAQAPVLREGNDVQHRQVSAAQKTVTLHTAPLKTWKAATQYSDDYINSLSYGQLLLLRNAYDAARSGMSAAFPTAVGNTASLALSAAQNAGVLEHFGLKSIAWGDAFRQRIVDRMAALMTLSAEFFHDWQQDYGVLEPQSAGKIYDYNIFARERVSDTFDPRPAYARYTKWEDLWSLYALGKMYHDTLQYLYDNDRATWDAIQALWPGLDQGAQAQWMDNLLLVTYLWRAYDMLDESIDFLDRSALYHAGAADNLEPPDWAETPYDDSLYLHPFQRIQTWHETAVGNVGFLDNLDSGGFDFIVNHVFRSHPSGKDYYALLRQRRDELQIERTYRKDAGFSEETWYSYRDFFTPLLAVNYAELPTEAIIEQFNSRQSPPGAAKPTVDGIWAKWEQYQALSSQALSYFTGAMGADAGKGMWAEIYGGYDQDVILPLQNMIFSAISARLTTQVGDAMHIILGAKEANEIDIKRTHPREGEITVLQWSTFARLRSMIDSLGHGEASRDLYAFLNQYQQLERLGREGYENSHVQEDYWFLINLVTTALTEFMNRPQDYYQSTALEPPEREPREGEDILAGHYYRDQQNPGGPANPADHSDPVMSTLIDKMDTLLTKGDLGDVLDAIDFSSILDLNTLGVDPDGPISVSTIVDGVMSNVLFNDSTLNLLVGALYPMVLNLLEDVFLTQVIGMLDNMDVNAINDSLPVGRVTMIDIDYPHLYRLLDSSDASWGTQGSFNRLRLYPNLLGSLIDAAAFPEARSALLAANPAAYRSTYTHARSKVYPTNAWDYSVSPGLYRPALDENDQPVRDDKGNIVYKFWLDWGLDRAAPEDRPALFKLALQNLLHGLYPLLEALLLNNTVTLSHPSIIGLSLRTNLGLYSNTTANMDLKVSGVAGFAQILTPLLEMLAGTDSTMLSLIPNESALTGYTWDASQSGAKSLVNSIMDPLLYFINQVKAKPLTEILDLLPNLTYLISTDQLTPLLQSLNINISYEADARLFNLINLSQVGAAIKGDLPAISISDLLLGSGEAESEESMFGGGGLDLGSLLSMDGLMDLLFSALGASITLPRFNPGRIATYGTIAPLSTKSYIPGVAAAERRRHYITANRADVMQALLGYILGSGLLPFGINSGDVTEAAAAVLELIVPVDSPAPGVTFYPPEQTAYDPYPEWWARKGGQAGKDKAKADGEYLLANADVLLDILWRSFIDPNLPFGEGVISVFERSGVDGGLYQRIVETIQSIFSNDTVLPMLEKYQGLLENLALINNQHFDLHGAIRQILDYQVDPDAVTYIYQLVDELVIFLEPIVPILDLLFAGADLALIDVDATPGHTPDSLVKVLQGSDGFVNAVKPLYDAFTVPLGLGEITRLWNPGDTPQQKLHSLLDPINDVYYVIRSKPVESLLALLPSLVYLTTESGGEASPLQQAMDSLLHPVYLLLDTLRPIVDVMGLIPLGQLPQGISLKGNEGLKIDVSLLLDGLLGNLTIGGKPLSLDLSRFLLGEFNSTTNTFEGDSVAVLFALLDQLGLLHMVEDLGLEGLTKLIQYQRFDGPMPVDYAKAPAPAEPAEAPSWFRKSHAAYLADNADLVLQYAWEQLLNLEKTDSDAVTQPIKAFLQGLIGEDITLGSSLPDSIDKLWGNERYVADNLVKAVELILSLRDSLEGIELPAIELLGSEAIPLTEVLAKLVYLYDQDRADADPLPLDLNALLAPMDALYENNAVYRKIMEDFTAEFLAQHAGEYPSQSAAEAAARRAALTLRAEARAAAARSTQLLSGITDEASAKAKLSELFAPLLPLLRLFLAESNALLILSPDKEQFIAERVDAFLTAFAEEYLEITPGATPSEALSAAGQALIDQDIEAQAALAWEAAAISPPTDADVTADDRAFLRVYGYNGYESGLLPLLLGLGADVPGFADTLLDYDAFKAADSEAQLFAILDPLLYLINALGQNPVQTLLQVLPNAAYFVSDGGNGGQGPSLLSQSIRNLLHPVTVLFDQVGPTNIEGFEAISAQLKGIADLRAGDMLNELCSGLLEGFAIEELILGTVQVFEDSYFSSLGTRGLEEDQASYVDTDLPALLVKLLRVTGAFDLIENSGFTGLIELLNVSDKQGLAKAEPIDYSQAPQPVEAAQLPAWLDEEAAAFLLSNADGVLDWAWQNVLLLETDDQRQPLKTLLEDWLADTLGLQVSLAGSLEDSVHALLGDTLYTQANFDALAALLSGLKESLNGMDLGIPGVTLTELLGEIAEIDGRPLDLNAMFAPLEAQALGAQLADGSPNPAYVTVTGQSFVAALTELLLPFMPLLNVLLAGDSIDVFVDDYVVEYYEEEGFGGEEILRQGFLSIEGGEGYRTGLLPLLLGLGADVPGFIEGDGADYPGLVSFEEYLALPDAERLEAILTPILYLFDQTARQPVNTLMQLLPNAAYFLGTGESGGSLLAQAVNRLLHPFSALLGVLPQGMLDLGFDLSDAGGAVSALLADLLSGFPLEALAAGALTPFSAVYPEGSYAYLAALGQNNAAAYLKSDRLLLLAQLLSVTGALEGLNLDDDTLKALVQLLNTDSRQRTPSKPLDYSKAPAAAAPGSMYPSGGWLTKKHSQFLTDNADGILDWAWRTLIADNDALLASLDLGFELTLKDSLSATIEGLLGSKLYTSDNLDAIVSMVLGLRDSLESVELLGGLRLTELLEEAVRIERYDEATGSTTHTALDISALFAAFDAYVPGTAVSGAEEFRNTLVELLTPLAPLLRVFLAEGDLLLIQDSRVNDNKGFVKVFGSNGYETALLPLLLGLGADVPGFLGTLTPYADILAAQDDALLLEAILDPILFLLERLTEQPVQTALQLFPNAAYFLGAGDGTSLLQQAIDNLLLPLRPVLPLLPLPEDLDLGNLNLAERYIAPLLEGLSLRLEDLVVGKVQRFSAMDPARNPGFGDYPALDALGQSPLGGQYLSVDQADLLAQLLKVFGVYDLLESNSLTGLVALLNYDGRTKTGLPPLSYPDARPNAVKDPLYNCLFWTEGEAKRMEKKFDQFLDDIALILFGKPLGAAALEGGTAAADSVLRDLLGNALYTQENFDRIVAALQGLLAGIDVNLELLPGRTLGDLLGSGSVVLLDGKPVDVLAILSALKTFPGAAVTGQQSFIDGLTAFLLPAAPLLDFLLFGQDLDILPMELVGGGSGQGLVTAFGYDGYQYGLILIYEALLLPLGGEALRDAHVKPASWFAAAGDAETIEALLAPILAAAELLVSAPSQNLLKLLPNLAYFTGQNSTGSSLLQDSLDRVLYAVNSLVGSLTGSSGRLVTLDISAMLDDLLGSLGLKGLDSSLLDKLRIGTAVEYHTLSGGGKGKYLALASEQDRADMITVLLRTLVGIVQDDTNREQIIQLLADAIIPAGNVGNNTLKLYLRSTLWWHRLLGTDYSLDRIHALSRIIRIFMPVILWIKQLTGFGL